MVDHTSEALVAEIQAAHDRLGLYNFSFGTGLGGIIEKAQEVYVRDEITKGLTEVATPGWYYLDKYNDREGERAELDQIISWHENPFDDAPFDDAAIIEPVHDEPAPDETHIYDEAYQAGYDAGYDEGWEDASDYHGGF